MNSPADLHQPSIKHLRLFIALPLPELVIEACCQVQTGFRARVEPGQGRLCRPESLHLTLHFLGQTDSRLLTELDDLLDRVASQTPVLPLGLESLDAFPKAQKARVLVWELARQPDLLTLRQALGLGLESLGFSLETRDYRPHLTLARFKIMQNISELPKPQVMNFSVDSMVLYQSEPGPAGSRYTALHQARFQGK